MVWEPGEVVRAQFDLFVPGDAAPGDYAGALHFRDGPRLLATPEDGAVVGFLGVTRRSPGTPAPGPPYTADYEISPRSPAASLAWPWRRRCSRGPRASCWMSLPITWT